MDLNDRMDHFSRAVARAVAACAGVASTVPEHDQDSIDINFVASDTDRPGAKLDAQLKSSKNITPTNGSFPYELKVKNYNDLRYPSEELYVPRILIVVHLPEDPKSWMDGNVDSMTLRHCAYWKNLAGAPETRNQRSISVDMPTDQIFCSDSLLAQMALPGEGLA